MWRRRLGWEEGAGTGLDVKTNKQIKESPDKTMWKERVFTLALGSRGVQSTQFILAGRACQARTVHISINMQPGNKELWGNDRNNIPQRMYI